MNICIFCIVACTTWLPVLQRYKRRQVSSAQVFCKISDNSKTNFGHNTHHARLIIFVGLYHYSWWMINSLFHYVSLPYHDTTIYIVWITEWILVKNFLDLLNPTNFNNWQSLGNIYFNIDYILRPIDLWMPRDWHSDSPENESSTSWQCTRPYTEEMT